jgi:hypothetical protein
VAALGVTHAPPCAAPCCLLFRKLDRAPFAAVLGAWAAAVLAATATAADAPDGLARDGKTLRGSRTHGAPGAHLLSAVRHRLGMTTGQVAVADTTNAIGMVASLLRGLLVEGRVVTMDALLTQREVAQTMTDGGGD